MWSVRCCRGGAQARLMCGPHSPAVTSHQRVLLGRSARTAPLLGERTPRPSRCLKNRLSASCAGSREIESRPASSVGRLAQIKVRFPRIADILRGSASDPYLTFAGAHFQSMVVAVRQRPAAAWRWLVRYLVLGCGPVGGQPLWEENELHGSAMPVSLPPELVTGLLSWNERMADAIQAATDAASVLARLNAEGEHLAKQVAAAVDGGAKVR
jgi:hypothetical protein